MLNPKQWRRPPKTPTIARLLTVLVLLFPATVWAQSWDEESFVKHGLTLVKQEQIQTSEQLLIDANVAEITAHPLPQLGLEYEPTWSNSSRRDEFTVSLHHTLDLTGWRHQLRTAAKLRSESVALQSEASKLDVANAIRLAFWKVRFHEDRLRIYTDVQARFVEALRIIEARASAGDAAGLDVLRIKRQLQLIQTEALSESLQLEEAWSQLDEWRAQGPRPALTGLLAPPDTTFAVRENPLLKQLSVEHSALSQEAEALGSPGFRNWEIGAGYRLENEDTTGHGALFSLTIPLALWSLDEPKKAAIQAKKDVLEVQKEVFENRLKRAQESSELRLNKALAALKSRSSETNDSELSDLITKAYGADEATLFDLIEALRSDVELGLARAELEWEARRAHIELQYLTSWEPPK